MDGICKMYVRTAVLISAMMAVWACADEIDAAKMALRDRLYPIAQSHALRLLENTSHVQAEQALLVLLEALYEQGRAAEVLAALAHYEPVVLRAKNPVAITYWQVKALAAQGARAEAARRAEEAVQQADNDMADALRQVAARAYFAVGNLESAVRTFNETDRNSTNALNRAANALEWATVLQKTNQLDAALAVLEAQAQLNVHSPDMDEGVLLRARILMAQGKMAEATARYNQLAMNDHASERARIQALVDMSVYLFNSGKTTEAISYARTAFDRAKQGELRRLAGFRLGDLLSASSQTIAEADKVIKGLVRDYPDDPASITAYLKLADAYFQLKNPERAATAYQMFLEAYPETTLNERVVQARAWALFQLGRYTEAVGLFQRVAEQTTNPLIRAECQLKQGDALMADQRFDDAAQVYLALAERQPESEFAGRALYQGAESLERAGSRALAGLRYAQTASLYPNQEYAPKALLRLALLQASTNDYAGATQTYTAIQNNYRQKDIRSEALMGRGRIAYRLFKFEEAMQDFATVSETDLGRRDEARMLITFCLYGLGRDKDARQSGTAFLVDFPESRWLPEMVLWLGKCDFNRGRFSDAKTFFLDYVTRWPKQSAADAALLWAARASASMGDFTGTVELIGRFVREYPKSPRQIEARLVQADALFELARFADVVLVLDQVLADATATGEWIVQAKIRRADGFFAMGADNSERYQKALAGYREVLEQSTVTPAEVLQLNYKVARCQEKLRKIDDALTTYYTDVILRYQNERAKGVWYDDAATALYVRAAFNMADLYEQRGQPLQAVNVLKRMAEVDVPGKEEALHRIGRLEKQR